jgi:hypothetical protein
MEWELMIHLCPDSDILLVNGSSTVHPCDRIESVGSVAIIKERLDFDWIELPQSLPFFIAIGNAICDVLLSLRRVVETLTVINGRWVSTDELMTLILYQASWWVILLALWLIIRLALVRESQSLRLLDSRSHCTLLFSVDSTSLTESTIVRSGPYFQSVRFLARLLVIRRYSSTNHLNLALAIWCAGVVLFENCSACTLYYVGWFISGFLLTS